MHLERAHLNLSKTSTKGKQLANTASLRKAVSEHEAWLKKQGLHKDQLDDRKKNFKKGKVKPLMDGLPEMPALSNNLKVNGGFARTSIMDKLQNESKEVRQEIINKSQRVAPAYNKGGYQFISPETDLTTMGKKV